MPHRNAVDGVPRVQRPPSPQTGRSSRFDAVRGRETGPLEGEKGVEGGCKPDSVPPKGRRPFLWARRHRRARAAYPEASPVAGLRGRTTLGFPIWPCSAWGLPCLLRCRRSGALLPHPFTLTPGRFRGWSALCGTFPRVAAAGRYPACRPSGVRTFLPGPEGPQRTPASSDPKHPL